MYPNSISIKIFQLFILSLAAIGLLIQFITSPLSIILPIIIIGLIYYLYKWPPVWLQRLAYRNRSSFNIFPRTVDKKKNRYPFRVIDGKKKKIY